MSVLIEGINKYISIYKRHFFFNWSLYRFCGI